MTAQSFLFNSSSQEAYNSFQEEERYDQVPAAHSTESATLPGWVKQRELIEEPGLWIFRDIPRTLMRRANAAAIQGKTVKGLAIELMEEYLKEMEKKGILPKGK